MYCRGIKRRIISLVISLIMVISLVSVMPKIDVKAEGVTEVDLTELNGLSGEHVSHSGAKGTAYEAGMVQIKLQLPEEYNSFAELNIILHSDVFENSVFIFLFISSNSALII